LDGPPVRITTPHIPLPAADILEDIVLPTPDRIAETVRRSLQGGRTFMRALWLIAASAVLVTLAQPLAAPTPPDPIVRTEGLRQVSPHVYIVPDNSVPLVPNVGFVIGERGILVIDTGLGPRNGSAVLEVAKKLGGSRALYLVVTHFHPEHDL